MKKSQTSTSLKSLKLFWQFTKPNKFMFWYGSVGASIAVIATDVLPALIIANAFNKIETIISSGNSIELSALMSFIYAYIAVRLFGILAWRTQAYVTWRYSILSKQRIYNHLFNHIQSMGSRFHADRFGGALVSQVNKFASAYDRFIADFTWSIITGITALIASLAVLLITTWQFALVMILYMACYFIIIYRRMKQQVPYNRDLASKESEQTAKLADAITNIATVRAFAGEKQEKALFSKQVNITTDADLELMKVQMKNELASQIGTASLNILAFVAGIIMITEYGAAVGTLVLAVSYTNSLARRLWDSMFILRNLNRSFADAADMTEILEIMPEVKDAEHPIKFEVVDGEIEFKNVRFGYQEKDHLLPVFEDLNLTLAGGEKIGLVGRSGGGKTTITKLLLRFADVQSGEILIDGHNIAKVRQSDLRKSITYVSQEPILFHRSIAENIRYGKPHATDQEVIEAAKLAHAHEFIKDLSQGYETLVGERGIKLSGGQKQRVAIARAMLKDAPILILDEATSALDSESESLIQDALWKLMEGKTAIVIAHRLSTIQRMDRIIVMDAGKIIEQGTHKELISQSGVYANLWNHQSGGFLED